MSTLFFTQTCMWKWGRDWNLKRIKKAEEINRPSCANKRKHVCHLPVIKNLVHLQQFQLLLFFVCFSDWKCFQQKPKTQSRTAGTVTIKWSGFCTALRQRMVLGRPVWIDSSSLVLKHCSYTSRKLSGEEIGLGSLSVEDMLTRSHCPCWLTGNIVLSFSVWEIICVWETLHLGICFRDYLWAVFLLINSNICQLLSGRSSAEVYGVNEGSNRVSCCFLPKLVQHQKGTELAGSLRLSRSVHHRHVCIPLRKAEIFLEVWTIPEQSAFSNSCCWANTCWFHL